MALTSNAASSRVSTRDVDPSAHTSAPYRTQRVFRLRAAPTAVWAVVGDHAALPSYFPGVDGVRVDNDRAEVAGGVGAVRHCDVHGMALTEDIVVYEPAQALGYKVRDGNPMGLGDHLGLVLLESDGQGGTLVRWKQFFDHPSPDEITGNIYDMMGGMVTALIERFGGEDVS